MNDDIRKISYVVDDLKRRNIFVSLLVTNGGRMQISWWDKERHQVVTGDLNGARLHLRALEENERQEIEWLAKRLGGGRSKGRGMKPAICAARFGT